MGKVIMSGIVPDLVAPSTVSSALNDNSWETISEVSKAGQAANYWNVGDTKTIVINGAVGATTFSNLSVDVFIIGIDHNSAIEGTNRIHFKIGKISGTQVALTDSQYGNWNGTFLMNNSASNAGGWSSSYMRDTILGNSNTPTSPLSGSLMAALPSELLSVMKAVTKYSDNTGGGSDTSSYVTSTIDYLFLLAEFEYHGSRTYANSAEQNYQAQYDYYKAGNSKIHYKHNDKDTAAYSSCRSVHSSNSAVFCNVGEDGTAHYRSASVSSGAAPAFVV